MATHELISSLLRLSREISLSSISNNPLLSPLSSSLSRKANLLSLLFEDLLSLSSSLSLSRSSLLSLNEILLLLHRLYSLIADASTWSRIRFLLQSQSVSDHLHSLTLDLSTLLDILPLNDLDISDDVKDVVLLLRRQCRRSTAADPAMDRIRHGMLILIGEIEREIVPDRSKLERIFEELGLADTRSCSAEIEIMEREIGDKVCGEWSSAMIALVGLIRYAKCVLFGASTPRSEPVNVFGSSDTEIPVPADFRCPISLDLMKDPVVVASGQTYDRGSIEKWIASGHATCPKTGQVLAHADLVPNRALKNLIGIWCREQDIPFDSNGTGEGQSDAVVANKAALEAARMTASVLVKKLQGSSDSTETANRVVHELRQLAKTGCEIRAFVGDAGAIPLLIPLLSSDDAGLQVNAVTALLNLSILEANKKRIMHADGAVDGVIHVLTDGATWQAKENAAATVLSLSAVHLYRKRLGRNQRLLAALISLVHAGPISTKKDALTAILSLAGERETIPRLVERKVIETVLELIPVTDVADEAAGIMAAVAKRGGAQELGATAGAVLKLVRVLKNGSDSARENAASALVILCRKVGGDGIVGELVRIPGIEWVIWELMGSGTERGRRKAASLGRICRRWVTAEDVAGRTARYQTAAAASASASTMAQA